MMDSEIMHNTAEERIFRKRVDCSLCGKDETLEVGDPVWQTGEALSDRNKSIKVVKCRSCGFYYINPMLFWGNTFVNSLFGDEYVPSYDTGWKKTRTDVDPGARFDRMESIALIKTGKFLDIGCGDGYALESALHRGWEAYGLEVSEFFARRTRKRLGIDVFAGQLEQAGYESDCFDAVYMDSVLEYIQDPNALIIEINRIMKAGGVLYILVPNEDSLIKYFYDFVQHVKRMNNTFKLSPRYQVAGYNSKSLKTLLEKNGFETKYFRVFRGIEPWKKLPKERLSDGNIRARFMTKLQEAVYTAGGVTGKGAMIEGIFRKSP